MEERVYEIKSSVKPTKGARYHRGSTSSAMDAAVRMSAGNGGIPVYLYPTYYGIQMTTDEGNTAMAPTTIVTARYKAGVYSVTVQLPE